jgi:hypothetical protein
MDRLHEEHLQRVIDGFSRDVRAKYEKGQQEHGGNLWQKPGMVDHAIEEVLDLAVYLYTLREQLAESDKAV